MDGDRDGKLSKDELLGWFRVHGYGDIPPGLWHKEDKDDDGFIQWEEFEGPKGDDPPAKEEL